jgi:hypothetical protein
MAYTVFVCIFDVMASEKKVKYDSEEDYYYYSSTAFVFSKCLNISMASLTVFVPCT